MNIYVCTPGSVEDAMEEMHTVIKVGCLALILGLYCEIEMGRKWQILTRKT
jgi:hypothetical protein